MQRALRAFGILAVGILTLGVGEASRKVMGRLFPGTVSALSTERSLSQVPVPPQDRQQM